MTDTRTPHRALYDRQIQFLVDKDVDGLVETNYAPDAELISFQSSAGSGSTTPGSCVTDRSPITSPA